MMRKKIVSLFLVAVMSAAMLPMLAACGQKPAEQPRQTQEDYSEPDEAPADLDETPEEEPEGMTLEELFATEEVQAEMAQVQQQASEQGIILDIYAEGDNLFYDYTLDSEVSADELDEIKAQLSDGMEQQREAVESWAKLLKDQCANDNITVWYVYKDSAGTDLGTFSFSAD